ncbi:hypothetical protein AB0M39_41045, partial [Streptomyces sp. NPDC051907]
MDTTTSQEGGPVPPDGPRHTPQPTHTPTPHIPLISQEATTEIPVHLLFRDDDSQGQPLALRPAVVARRQGTGELPKVGARGALNIWSGCPYSMTRPSSNIITQSETS